MYKYKDWDLDSEEELVFCHWLEELQALGFVKEFSKCYDSISICEPVSLPFQEKLKTKVVDKSVFTFHSLSYTPDFYIKWSESADGIFVKQVNRTYTKQGFEAPFIAADQDVLFSLVDVKGSYVNKNVNSSITFPLIQKFLYSKAGIFVQKIVPLGPKGLFKKTFTPNYYLKTKTGKERKISSWKARSLQQFLKERYQS